MNTRQAFKAIHTPETKYEADKERKTWVESTWHLKKGQRKQLAELRK